MQDIYTYINNLLSTNLDASLSTVETLLYMDALTEAKTIGKSFSKTVPQG